MRREQDFPRVLQHPTAQRGKPIGIEIDGLIVSCGLLAITVGLYAVSQGVRVIRQEGFRS